MILTSNLRVGRAICIGAIILSFAWSDCHEETSLIHSVFGSLHARAWYPHVTCPCDADKAVPRHVKVTASIPARLPAVAVARHRLTQAVLNLVVNAGEAIPARRRRRQGRVHVWAKATGDATAVQLGVTDDGTGMTEEVKRRAFEVRRLHSMQVFWHNAG
jgi:signal transduction histidine kinase